MFGRLGQLARDLAGRNDEVLVGHLLAQVDTALDALALALAVASGRRGATEVADEVAEVEERGDRHRDDLVEDLAAVLAPPIDREDLFRLSRSLQDVASNSVDLVREMELFGIDHEPLVEPMLEAVVAGMGELRTRVAALVDQPEMPGRGTRDGGRSRVRRAYQDGLAELLNGHDVVSSTTVKRRQLLRRVDVLGLRLGEAVGALADGSIKRNA